MQLFDVAKELDKSKDWYTYSPCYQTRDRYTENHKQVSPLVADLFVVLKQSVLAFYECAIDRLGNDTHNGRVEEEQHNDRGGSRLVTSLLRLDSSAATPDGPEEFTNYLDQDRHASEHYQPDVIKSESTFSSTTQIEVHYQTIDGEDCCWGIGYTRL